MSSKGPDLQDFMPSSSFVPQRSALNRTNLSDFLLLLIISIGGTRLLLPVFDGFFLSLPWSDDAVNAARLALGLMLHSLIALITTWFIFFYRRQIKLKDIELGPWSNQWLRTALPMAAPIILTTLLINYTISLLLGDSFNNPQSTVVETLGHTPSSLVVLITGTLIIAPVLEEIIFRGLLLGWLELKMSRLKALMVSSLAFALVHGAPLLVPALFVAGMGFGFARQKAKSLWPAIVLHAIFNGLSVLLILSAPA
ncbi:CPBP family intramembrane glutamic endopeptidase [Kiloniella sp. b19]|uniref:CPBP family intramembrane glutamic endopeptidase n=1 Tax=Kiloniella sp. GXU_MW_B19 TaxID=3141326 RepID=UPI0031DD6858